MRFFSGELDGKKARDLVDGMDNTLDNFTDRLEQISRILEGTKFFEMYFEDYFPRELSQDDFLSIDDNICMLLENYGSYLINSRDLDRDEGDNYKIYYDETEFRRALKKSFPLSKMDLIPFYVDKDKNYKVAKDQKILTKDLKRDDELGVVLREYQNYIDNLELTGTPLRRMNRIKGEIQRDMIISKDQLLGVFGYELDGMNETESPDYSKIDFTNHNHLKGMSVDYGKTENIWVDGLLRMGYNGDLQNDFQCIIYDLNKIVEQTKFSRDEYRALRLFRRGYNGSEIADELQCTRQWSNKLINNAVKKIANKAKELQFHC